MPTVYKAYKYRIYPTESQKELLAKHFGAVRFVYNLALETKIEAYRKGVNLSCYELQRQIKDLKIECEWLKEISRYALDKSIENLDNAYKSFFNGKGFPAFKKKKTSGSYTISRNTYIKDGKLFTAKFREGIEFVQHRLFEGEIRRITISKTATKKYYASLLVATEVSPLSPNNNIVGIDLGIKTFAVLSDGKEYNNPKYLRNSISRISVLQRRASRKKIGSSNRKKANLRVAVIHERVNNQRKDFLHKISNEITNQNGMICIEDLAISNMVKNHKLALSISDASWSEFSTMLKYKTAWRGRKLVIIDRYDPTTKTCSNCGNIQDMPLIERTYNCSCGLSIDRDLNAAINIRNSGILRAGEPMELPSLGGAMK